MANPEHMKVLAQGAEAWNSWRRQHPKVKPDLEGAILTRAELPSVNLAGADLRNARLEGINLSEAILTSADLRAAHICGAELTGASFVAKSMSRLDPASMDLAGKNAMQHSTAALRPPKKDNPSFPFRSST